MPAVRRSLLAVLVAASTVAASCARTDPAITISAERIPRHGRLEVQGEGFTARRSVSSHLRRADGSEFPVLPILTDGEGRFHHTIETMILELGTHELWVADDTTGRTSNRVTFEVTFDYSNAQSSSAIR